MKFDQTMASAILSILCVTTIFGSEGPTSPYVYKDLCEIIDKYRGNDDPTLLKIINDVSEDVWGVVEEYRKDDGWYERTSHIEPYSFSLDLLQKDLPKFCTTLALPLIQATCLQSESALLAFLVSPKIASTVDKVNKAAERLANSRLLTEFSEGVAIRDNLILIAGLKRSGGHTLETRPISDIQCATLSSFPVGMGFVKNRTKRIIEKDEGQLCYELTFGKINIFMSCDYRSLDKFCSTSKTPKKKREWVTDFAVSKDQRTIATLNEWKGDLCVYEFQDKKSLYKTMHTDMNKDLNTIMNID